MAPPSRFPPNYQKLPPLSQAPPKQYHHPAIFPAASAKARGVKHEFINENQTKENQTLPQPPLNEEASKALVQLSASYQESRLATATVAATMPPALTTTAEYNASTDMRKRRRPTIENNESENDSNSNAAIVEAAIKALAAIPQPPVSDRFAPPPAAVDGLHAWSQRRISRLASASEAANKAPSHLTATPYDPKAASQSTATSYGLGSWQIPKRPAQKQSQSLNGSFSEASSSYLTLPRIQTTHRELTEPVDPSVKYSGLTLPRIRLPKKEPEEEVAINTIISQRPPLPQLTATESEQSNTIAPNFWQRYHDPQAQQQTQTQVESQALLNNFVHFSYPEDPCRNPLAYMAQGHQVPGWADPFMRLKCFVIDFALSPSLAHRAHFSGSYFTPSPVTRVHTIYTMEFSHVKGNMAQVAQAYDLSDDVHKILMKIETWSERSNGAGKEGYTYYCIRCSGEAFYATGNAIEIVRRDGSWADWKAEIGPCWRLGGYEDRAVGYLKWSGIVKLLAAYAEMAFDMHGDDRRPEEVRKWVAETERVEGVDDELWARLAKAGGFGMSMGALRPMGVEKLELGEGSGTDVARVYGGEVRAEGDVPEAEGRVNYVRSINQS